MGKHYDMGVTFGCWDLLHAGHMLFLRAAMDYCDSLIVGLHVNPQVERPGIKNKPIQSLFERFVQLDMLLRDDDRIVPYETEDDIVTLINSYQVDVRLIGSDYEGKSFTGKDMIPTIFIPRDHGYSTSDLRRRVAAAENKG